MLFLFGCNNKKKDSKTSTMNTKTEVSMEDVKEMEEVVTKIEDAQAEIDASGKELESLLDDLD